MLFSMGFTATLDVTPTLRRLGYTLVSAVREVAARERLQVSVQLPEGRKGNWPYL